MPDKETIKHPYLSVIIPFFIKDRKSYIYKRTLTLIEAQFPTNIEVIFVDSTKNREIASSIKSKCHQEQKYYVPSKQIDTTYSLAKARNAGALAAHGEYIFFMDVDFIYSDVFWSKLHQKIMTELSGKENKYKFLMLPCLYLNDKSTHLLGVDRKWSTFRKIRNSVLRGDNRYVETIAISSSTIVLKRDYFLGLGGFNTEYLGHGREEFDLLHRLSIRYPIGKKPSNYTIDAVRHFPAKYKGFRKYFAYYALPLLFEPLFLLHLHHKRSRSNIFYQNRKKNEKKFQINIRKYDKSEGLQPLGDAKPISLKNDHPHQQSLLPLKKFIAQLQASNGFDPNKYVGLYRYNTKPKVQLTNFTMRIKKSILKSQDILIGSKNKFLLLDFKNKGVEK